MTPRSVAWHFDAYPPKKYSMELSARACCHGKESHTQLAADEKITSCSCKMKHKATRDVTVLEAGSACTGLTPPIKDRECES
jgi:hypothetical protein